MNILITGGTGFIGRRFIERYEDNEYTVLTRSIMRANRVLPGRVGCIESLAELSSLDEFDAVINLAGEPIIDKRWLDAQKQRICNSRWGITEQLAALFQQSDEPPGVFLSGSAIGVYGDHGTRTITESDKVRARDFPSRVCTYWESIAQKAEPASRVVLLRTGIVLDRNEGALKKMLLPFKLGAGGRLGNGLQYMSWIHIEDMLEAIHFLLNHPTCSGPFNLVSPNPVPNRDFTKVLAKTLHRPAVMPMPKMALQMMLGESACLLLDSQKVLPSKLKACGFEFKFEDLNSAMSNLLEG